jgi:hypothetical protein
LPAQNGSNRAHWSSRNNNRSMPLSPWETELNDLDVLANH